MQNSLTLALPALDSRSIEIYSSNSKNCYLPQKNIDNKFHVIPNSINHIRVQTKTFTPEQQRIVVNAVDSDSGKLVYSWLLILASMKPNPTQSHQLQARINTSTLGKIQFTNKLKQDLVFEIASSREDLMSPRQSLLSFRGNETQTLELDIHPQQQMGLGEVFLYVSDLDQHVMECIKLEILFIQ